MTIDNNTTNWFIKVPTSIIKDTNLSLAEKGLCALLASFIVIPNFTIKRSYILSLCKEKETAFTTAWNGIKNKSILIQKKIKNTDSGLFEYTYSLSEELFPSDKSISFTPAVTKIIRDKNISLKAKGLYLMFKCLNNIPGFKICRYGVLSYCKESITSYKSTSKELRVLRILRIYKKTKKNGQYSYIYVVNDNRLNHENYVKYLNSPHWKDIRKSYLSKHPTCELCGSHTKLQIHHKSYDNIGCETENDLMTLCEKCHQKVTSNIIISPHPQKIKPTIANV